MNEEQFTALHREVRLIREAMERPKSYRELWEQYAGQAMLAIHATESGFIGIEKAAQERGYSEERMAARISLGMAKYMLREFNNIVPPTDRTCEDLDFLHHLLGDDVETAVVDGVAKDCGIDLKG